MAYRPQLDPHIVLDAGSMAGDLTSDVTIINKLSMVSYAYSWTGTTPVGTVSVQLSNDYKLSADGQTVVNPGTWTTMTVDYNGSPVTTVPVSGNTGNGFVDIDATAAYAIRTIYTRGSGTGSLTVTIAGKVT